LFSGFIAACGSRSYQHHLHQIYLVLSLCGIAAFFSCIRRSVWHLLLFVLRLAWLLPMSVAANKRFGPHLARGRLVLSLGAGGPDVQLAEGDVTLEGFSGLLDAIAGGFDVFTCVASGFRLFSPALALPNLAALSAGELFTCVAFSPALALPNLAALSAGIVHMRSCA
jgi:hypothetical protein